MHNIKDKGLWNRTGGFDGERCFAALYRNYGSNHPFRESALLTGIRCTARACVSFYRQEFAGLRQGNSHAAADRTVDAGDDLFHTVSVPFHAYGNGIAGYLFQYLGL